MTPSILPSRAGFLGLDRVVRRLIAEDGFEDREAALRGIAGYERFFLLAARRRREPLVPSARVDLVWQRHMLDTRAYAEDCARWAGTYIHRDDGAPPGGFERTLDLMGDFDRPLWDRPGPASARDDPDAPARPGGSLDREDFSGVLARVRSALPLKPSAPPWVVEARQLVESDPALAVGEYRRFLALLIDESGPLTPCKLVDEFWHQHILDSREYARFCARTAGRYLHHEPSYEKPHRSHIPGFRRTQAVYRRRIGSDPPPRVWAHMGESGGGGDGGSYSPPPPPLYATDTPQCMEAILTVGGVDRRHYKQFHPILTRKGLPQDLWCGLLRAIDATPRIGWAEFSADPGSSPRTWAVASLAVGLLPSAMLCGFYGVNEPGGVPIPVALTISAFLMILIPLVYAQRWSERPYDRKDLLQTVARFAPIFRQHGVILTEDDSGKVVIDAAFTDAEMLFWEQEKERERLTKVAEELRVAEASWIAREDARRAREDARRRRRADRDEYYRDRGIKPGPWAWYEVQPEWAKAALIGLAAGLPIALVVAGLFFLVR